MRLDSKEAKLALRNYIPTCKYEALAVRILLEGHDENIVGLVPIHQDLCNQYDFTYHQIDSLATTIINLRRNLGIELDPSIKDHCSEGLNKKLEARKEKLKMEKTNAAIGPSKDEVCETPTFKTNQEYLVNAIRLIDQQLQDAEYAFLIAKVAKEEKTKILSKLRASIANQLERV